jgi:hypothetical protein
VLIWGLRSGRGGIDLAPVMVAEGIGDAVLALVPDIGRILNLEVVHHNWAVHVHYTAHSVDSADAEAFHAPAEWSRKGYYFDQVRRR